MLSVTVNAKSDRRKLRCGAFGNERRKLRLPPPTRASAVGGGQEGGECPGTIPERTKSDSQSHYDPVRG